METNDTLDENFTIGAAALERYLKLFVKTSQKMLEIDEGLLDWVVSTKYILRGILSLCLCYFITIETPLPEKQT